jgi:hypothetical protein
VAGHCIEKSDSCQRHEKWSHIPGDRTLNDFVTAVRFGMISPIRRLRRPMSLCSDTNSAFHFTVYTQSKRHLTA